MSLVAAIGYAIGIFLFAIIIRRYRRQIIKKYVTNAEAERSQQRKGSKHD